MNRRSLIAAILGAPIAGVAAGTARAREVQNAFADIVYNVDARGATADAIARLPEILRENNARLEARILDRLRRHPLT